MVQTPKDNDLILIRASQAWPFVDTLTRLGGPVVTLCRRAGMPLKAVRAKRGVIGGRSLWRFVGYASEHMNLEHFGYLTAVDHPVNSAGRLGSFRLRMAPTLEHLVRYFIEDIRSQTTGIRYSLKKEDGHTWFERDPVIRDQGASWQAEQYVIMFIVQIVRLYAGQKWLPVRLRITSQPYPVPVPSEWSPIAIEWGCTTTGIRIDADTMAIENPDFAAARADLCDELLESSLSRLHIEDLVDRQIWSQDLGIENTANELGVSVTTFKRRLNDIGQTYSAIVEDRRMHWAKKLLAQPHVPISSIAHTLGYAHTSNFSRAFSRIEGVAPFAYRTQLLTN